MSFFLTPPNVLNAAEKLKKSEQQSTRAALSKANSLQEGALERRCLGIRDPVPQVQLNLLF